MRNERAWPQQCWKNCANGSNIVALHFGDHGTKEMLGVVGWKGWLVSNFAQQHATTCNRVCKRTQHVTSNNVWSCWSTCCVRLHRALQLFRVFYKKKGDVLMLFLKNQQWSKDYDEVLSDAGNDKGYERKVRPLYILMKTVQIGHWSVTIGTNHFAPVLYCDQSSEKRSAWGESKDLHVDRTS